MWKSAPTTLDPDGHDPARLDGRGGEWKGNGGVAEYVPQTKKGHGQEEPDGRLRLTLALSDRCLKQGQAGDTAGQMQ